MQWDRVERMPAVVALKVMASPLKSIPFMALGLAGENTGREQSKAKLFGFFWYVELKTKKHSNFLFLFTTKKGIKTQHILF